jgi:vacuolar-type H+-ATPase subunit E/Vma4
MRIYEQLDELEHLVQGGKVPGTSRCLVNLDKFMAIAKAMRDELPAEIADASTLLRQKESIIKQAELEARRIRGYADEEAATIRQMAEEQTSSAIASATDKARKMIEQTNVLQAAEQRAKDVLAEAEAKANEILAKAKDESKAKIVHAAESEAAARRKGADDYAREVLFALEERVAEVLGQVRKGIDVLDRETTASTNGATVKS